MGRSGRAIGDGVVSAETLTLPASDWFTEARALFLKDVRAELRTKVAVNAVGLFAIASLLLIALSTRDLKDLHALRFLNLPPLQKTFTMGDVEGALIPAWSPS